jgi:hypothetical protein
MKSQKYEPLVNNMISELSILGEEYQTLVIEYNPEIPVICDYERSLKLGYRKKMVDYIEFF